MEVELNTRRTRRTRTNYKDISGDTNEKRQQQQQRKRGSSVGNHSSISISSKTGVVGVVVGGIVVWWGGAEAVVKAVARALQSTLSSTAASPTTCHFYKDKATKKKKKKNVSVRAVIAAGRNDACIPQEKHANQKVTCTFADLCLPHSYCTVLHGDIVYNNQYYWCLVANKGI